MTEYKPKFGVWERLDRNVYSMFLHSPRCIEVWYLTIERRHETGKPPSEKYDIILNCYGDLDPEKVTLQIEASVGFAIWPAQRNAPMNARGTLVHKVVAAMCDEAGKIAPPSDEILYAMIDALS